MHMYFLKICSATVFFFFCFRTCQDMRQERFPNTALKKKVFREIFKMSQIDVAAVPLLNNQNGTAADNNHNFTGSIGPPFSNNNMNITRNNNNPNPLFRMRDRLFHALFIKASLAYARTFPRPVRRFIEFLILMKVSTVSYLFFLF